jgi:hypothetical protein
MNGNVKGTFFLDYVRMIKSRKDLDWSALLLPEDLVYLKEKIQGDQWYPMDTFERMGIGIFEAIADKNVEAARLWGRLMVDALSKLHPDMISEGEPRESLIRFQVVRGGFFDFDPINILVFFDNYAKIEIAYGMSAVAEMAACYQSAGYFERMLELSGASNIRPNFTSRKWEGAPSTILEINWSNVAPGQMVKGQVISECVRVIKGRKDVDWSPYLRPEDLELATQEIAPQKWYPFQILERMALAIHNVVAHGDLAMMRLWGQQSVGELIRTNPTLVSTEDPRESLLRFQVLRRSFFNFDAIDIESLYGNYAKIRIDYDASRAAEEIASHQALGFFEKLLELSGATDIQHKFTSRAWEGDASTALEMKWS